MDIKGLKAEFLLRRGSREEFWITEEIGGVVLALIDAEIARQTDLGSQSDGYHTFNELYDQRAVLFASLCKSYPQKAWRSLKHSDGTMFDGGYFICGIETPNGQYTYHYKLHRWGMFDYCKTLDLAPEWDGHTDKDVERLLSIARQTVTNLCSHCQWGCMGACPQTDNIVFGCGLGNDNVVECENYINRIAYTRYQAHQTVTDDKVRNEIERNNECIKWLKGTKVTGSKRCVFFMQRCNKLLQLMQTEPWIPVSERLPDHNNPVLINVPDYNLNDGKYLGYITIGGYQNGTWYQGSVGYPGAVTHWQPLPEPPKECHD